VSVGLVSWLCVFGVVALVAVRSRPYAIFRAVQLSLHTALVLPMLERLGAPLWLFGYLSGALYLSALLPLWPVVRGPWVRVLVTVPSAFFVSGTVLGLPWVLVALFGFELPLPELPYAVAAFGVLQSSWTRPEVVHIAVSDGVVPELARHKSGPLRVERPLRLVQITDPHIGPFMPPERLARICQEAIDKNPDLILLTGDFLTMEAHDDPELLARALEPLRQMPGRVFACLGNHDYEAPEIVRGALERAGARLLVDERAMVDTPAGPVEIVGAAFVWQKRAEHLAQLMARFPRNGGALRLLLLHDPGAFKHVPEGTVDLTLSGHTHGGQVGLLSLGLPWTMLRLFVKMPDHGLWARGSDRLYVHRGTGHYGFPLRIGVPAEESLLLVHAPAPVSAE
jgi:predicted MPP superfamily phosphohydrolase